MKKFYALLVVLSGLSFVFPVFADTASDIDSLYESMGKEEWGQASQKAEKLLLSYPQEDKMKAAIRYCYIMSSAGLVATDKLSFKELEARIVKLKGQKIMTFGYMLLPEYKDKSFSAFIDTENAMIKIFAANQEQTNIFSFIDIPLDVKSQQKNVGKRCYFFGEISAVEIHDSPRKIWLMRITMDRAEVLPEE